VSGVTYDSGALIAAERGSVSMWALHRRLLERGVCPTVSTPVLGQVWRGGPQAQLSRLLRGCRVEPLSEPQARAAGAALARCGGEDIVDAAVVVGALAREDLVLASDPDDLRRIASAIDGVLALHVV
jgi:hypothetical protein